MSFNAKEFLTIDISALEREYLEAALKYNEVSDSLAAATRQLSEHDLRIGIAEATFCAEVRSASANSKVRMTEKALDEKMMLSPELQIMREQKIGLKENREVLVGLQRSLEHRRESLKSLSYTMRQESPLTDGLDPDKVLS